MRYGKMSNVSMHDCNSKEAQSIVLYFKCCLNIVLMIKISLSTSEFKKQIRWGIEKRLFVENKSYVKILLLLPQPAGAPRNSQGTIKLVQEHNPYTVQILLVTLILKSVYYLDMSLLVRYKKISKYNDLVTQFAV